MRHRTDMAQKRGRRPKPLKYTGATFWTEARTAELLILVRGRLSDGAIAKKLGTTRGSVTHRLRRLREAGIAMPVRAPGGPGTDLDLPPIGEEREDSRAVEQAASACDLHLLDLMRAYPKGPPADVAVRTGFVPARMGTIEAVLP